MTKMQANYQKDLIDYIELSSYPKAIKSSNPAIREEEVQIRLSRLIDTVSSLRNLISLIENNSKRGGLEDQNYYLLRFAKDHTYDLGNQISDLSDDVHLHFQEPV